MKSQHQMFTIKGAFLLTKNNHKVLMETKTTNENDIRIRKMFQEKKMENTIRGFCLMVQLRKLVFLCELLSAMCSEL